jgi:short-subunit dehydrogenase
MWMKSIVSLVSAGWAIKKAMYSSVEHVSLRDKVVFITGGSKGLGLVLAEELFREGCRIAICARDEADLEEARRELSALGAEVFSVSCDVSDKAQVEEAIRKVIGHFGRLDILVNNAGVIQVGPMESFSAQDYEKAMNIMYWGVAYPTLAVLPQMRSQGGGHIVNVTSIGGKVAVPHLLPYSAAKFAAVGFSEGITAELKKDKVYVTTVIPWLMRTGSYVNAYFQRDNRALFKLFSFMSSAPVLTVNAERAAKKIVEALKEKREVKIIGFQAKLAMDFHHYFPELTHRIFGLVNELLPDQDQPPGLERGKEITERHDDAEVPGIRKFGEAAQAAHQHQSART